MAKQAQAKQDVAKQETTLWVIAEQKIAKREIPNEINSPNISSIEPCNNLGKNSLAFDPKAGR